MHREWAPDNEGRAGVFPPLPFQKGRNGGGVAF